MICMTQVEKQAMFDVVDRYSGRCSSPALVKKGKRSLAAAT